MIGTSQTAGCAYTLWDLQQCQALAVPLSRPQFRLEAFRHHVALTIEKINQTHTSISTT